MARSRLIKTVGVAFALAGLASPTMAMAANPAAYSPLVSLSMVASPQSQTALCARAASEAAANAAATAATTSQGQPAPGCVLPVPDAAAAPIPGDAAVAPSSGFSPLLIGLGAIGLGVLLFALLHNDKDEPPPQPVSPA